MTFEFNVRDYVRGVVSLPEYDESLKYVGSQQISTLRSYTIGKCNPMCDFPYTHDTAIRWTSQRVGVDDSVTCTLAYLLTGYCAQL